MKGRDTVKRFCRTLLCIGALSLFLVGCDRTDKAVDTYNRIKEMKSDFQKKSEDVQKEIAEKSENYKERIRKEVGLTPRAEDREGQQPESRESRNEGKAAEDDRDRD